MKIAIMSAIASVLLASPLFGQTVFPQYVTGRSGTLIYKSTLFVTSNDTFPLDCTLLVSSGGGRPLVVFELPPKSWRIVESDDTIPLTTGFATLRCLRTGTSAIPTTVSTALSAQLIYSLADERVGILSETAVYPATRYSLGIRLIVDQRRGARTGIAFLTDATFPVQADIFAADATGALIGAATITIPPDRATARFVDEWIPLTANYVGEVAIVARASVGLYAMGVRFDGPAFTSIGVTQGAFPPQAGGIQ